MVLPKGLRSSNLEEALSFSASGVLPTITRMREQLFIFAICFAALTFPILT
jgi:hypothetical protein